MIFQSRHRQNHNPSRRSSDYYGAAIQDLQLNFLNWTLKFPRFITISWNLIMTPVCLVNYVKTVYNIYGIIDVWRYQIGRAGGNVRPPPPHTHKIAKLSNSDKFQTKIGWGEVLCFAAFLFLFLPGIGSQVPHVPLPCNTGIEEIWVRGQEKNTGSSPPPPPPPPCPPSSEISGLAGIQACGSICDLQMGKNVQCAQPPPPLNEILCLYVNFMRFPAHWQNVISDACGSAHWLL